MVRRRPLKRARNARHWGRMRAAAEQAHEPRWRRVASRNLVATAQHRAPVASKAAAGDQLGVTASTISANRPSLRRRVP